MPQQGWIIGEYFKRLLLLIVTPECYEIFFDNYNFFHGQCLKASFSKVLGLGIVAGSVLVKVPQILKIIANKSGAGISIIGQLLELYGVLANVSYSYIKGYPFSAWGEGVFMLIQTSMVIALVMFFGSLRKIAAVFLCFLSLLVYVLISGLTALNILWMMQAVSVPVMFVGKAIQAWSNFNCKTMGQQSLVTCFMLFAGSLARIFTSVQETGDSIIIFTYALASLANGIIFAQFFIYPTSKEEIPARPARKKKKKE